MLENKGFKIHDPDELKTDSSEPKYPGSQVAKYSHEIWHSAGPYQGVDTTTDNSFLRYHKYIQWVAGILFFQVRMFLSSTLKFFRFLS